MFKIITTAAAIEEKDDLDQFRYTCTGSLEVGGDVITCPYAHGADMDINQCLACSCNGAYATLAMELGAHPGQVRGAGGLAGLPEYQRHLHRRRQLCGGGGRRLPGLVRGGPGQGLGEPLLPAGLYGEHRQRGRGRGAQPGGRRDHRRHFLPAALPDGKDTYETYSAETCQRLKEMMRNNVVTEYGQSQFGDLAVCAKSGTAEVGGGAEPHAWFAGFIDDPDHPLAFVVLVENGAPGPGWPVPWSAQVLAQATAE